MTDSVSTSDEAMAFNARQPECPQCGESNPVEAVMCWACYAPLGEGQNATASSRAPSRREQKRWVFQTRRQQLVNSLPFVGAVFLIASGYNRKARFPLLSLGTLALTASWAKSHDFRITRPQRDITENSPIERIADTILQYAVRDGASKIRLRAGVGVHVHYFIGDEWQEQMKIPGFVWNDLCAHLIEQSDNWKKPIIFQINEERFEFAPHFERDFPLETLTLSLSPLP